jgi:hypothetical protein
MGKTNFEKEEFEILKQRLLLRRLDETPIWELHALVMQEAEMSALVAQTTTYPFLVFPCLFEERVRSASDLFHKKWDAYWDSLDCGSPELLPQPTTSTQSSPAPYRASA